MLKKCIKSDTESWPESRVFQWGPGTQNYIWSPAPLVDDYQPWGRDMFREGLWDRTRLHWPVLPPCPQSVSLSMIISPDTPEGGEEALQKYFWFLFLINLSPSCTQGQSDDCQPERRRTGAQDSAGQPGVCPGGSESLVSSEERVSPSCVSASPPVMR